MPIHGYPGGVISATPPSVTPSGASGVFTTEDQMQYQTAGNWPMAATQISRSLRFNSADSAYLNRTPASAGNRTTWTWSAWVKRSGIGVINQGLFRCYNGTSDSTWTEIRLGVNNASYYDSLAIGGYNTNWRITNAQYRDPSAWYHFVVVWDSSNATADNRVKIYVNGVQETSFFVSNNPTQNAESGINQASSHIIGHGNTAYLDGYLTEVNFIDGYALTPSSFGQTNSNTGVWEPRQYTGPYGTNGFYLNFSDNSGTTSTTLGKDYSGNGNNWTPNNFSVTAGAGNDSLVDTPTPYGTDTGAGGEVRGNYATLNPLDTSGLTFANGNLEGSINTTSWRSAKGTISMASGKWYFECTPLATWDYGQIGVIKTASALPAAGGSGYLGINADSWCYQTIGQYLNNGTGVTSGISSAASGDIIMVAVDVDAGKLWFGKNGTWFNSGAPATGSNAAYTNLSGAMSPAAACYNNASGLAVNFGQRPFAYTAPSGYKALCTQNLPTPTIGATSTTQANRYFDAYTYTGTGVNPLTISAFNFAPEFVWIKSRSSGSAEHSLFDIIRGATKYLFSNTTGAEGTNNLSLTAFNSNGYTLGNSGIVNDSNTATYVSWNWNAGGSNATNTSGTITSTVRANTTSGFSIVTYTGTGANATVGHGLGVAPSMVIVKRRSAADAWYVYHINLTSAAYALQLNSTIAQTSLPTIFNSTAPTSTVFSIGTDSAVNASSATYVAYCFAPVAGYSAFGTYTGNASTDGPFVYTGFRPRFIFGKDSGATNNWWIFDSARDTYNVAGKILRPNLIDAELDSPPRVDLLSNGFKMRTVNLPNDATTYIYAAFAESPFKYALAR